MANTAVLFALTTPIYIGDTYFVMASSRFYTYNGGDRALAAGYRINTVNDGDRFLDKSSGTVYDFVAPATLRTIATATTDGGDLYIVIKSDGVAWRSDGSSATAWKRWGFIPSTEDFKTTKDWLKQWSSAAKLSGGGFFFSLDTVVSALDSDGDGLPDDWELAHGLDPFDPTGDNGAYGDPDEDGLWNINEYLVGTDPKNKDSDNNGVWDSDEDFDRDGLTNLTEQDVTGTRLDKVDTDDDFLTDWEETFGPPHDFTNTNVWAYATNLSPRRLSNPLSSLDPPKQMSASFAGNGRMLIPEQSRHALLSWTLEAWVWPSNLTDGIVIRRTVTNTLRQATAVNYELGVRTNELGFIVPYADISVSTSMAGRRKSRWTARVQRGPWRQPGYRGDPRGRVVSFGSHL